MTTVGSRSGDMRAAGEKAPQIDGTPSVDQEPAEPVTVADKPRVPVWVIIVALALGGFGIGTTEFVTMGLLPNIATGIGVSVPKAGHLISAYALGVVVGAPIIAVFGARLSRRTLLMALMAAFVLGNGASALSNSYGPLVVARFAAGLPHGAYFGVASLVAASLVPPNKRAQAVGGVMLGLSVANVAGVPFATFLGQHYGWHSAYWSVVAVGLTTILALLLFAPRMPVVTEASYTRELGALRSPQVLVTLAVGTVGFGGMFAVYSYVTPTLVHVAGLGIDKVPIVLAIYGLGMVSGNIGGARLVDRLGERVMVGGIAGLVILLALFPMAAHNPISATADFFFLSLVATTVIISLQARLMDVAGDAQTLAASLNHAALNMGNALGAWLGGLVIAAGFGWTSPAWVGVGLGLSGLAILMVSRVVTARGAATRASVSG